MHNVRQINKKKRLDCLLAIVFCLTIYLQSPCYGQGESYSFQHYTNNENGLPQNSVSDIEFDKNGYLWMTTQDGLCRYDGVSFFTYDMTNTPSLKSSRFISFSRDENGYLRVADQYLNFYRITDDLKIKNDAGLPCKNIKDIGFARFFSYGNLQSKNKYWQNFFRINRDADWDIFSLGNREVYVAVGKYIYYFNDLNNIASQIATSKDYRAGNDDTDHALVVSKNLFVLLTKNGNFIYKNGKLQTGIRFSPDAGLFFKDVFNGRARLIINHNLRCSDYGMKGRSLFRFIVDGNKIDIRFIVRDFPVMPIDINVIRYDSTSRFYFVGTSTQGLFILRPNPLHAMQLSNKNNINNNVVYDIVGTGNGWFMCRSQFFNIYTRETILFSRPLESGSLFRASNGGFYFVRDKTLFFSDNWPKNSNVIKPISYYNAAYCETSGHRLFLGFNGFLWVRDGKGEIRKILQTGNGISIIFEYNENILWLLGPAGLFEFDIKNNSISRNPIFLNHDIRSIYRAKDSSIWLGTYGKGFFCYYKNKFVQLPLDPKNALKNTHNFYEDDNGFFWMPTNNGIIQCLRKDLQSFLRDPSALPYYYRYDHNDGLPADELNGSAQSPYALDSNGMLVYPTLQGIAYFKPTETVPYLVTGRVCIEYISIDGKQASPDSMGQIKPSFTNLTVKFGCPYFGNLENIRLEYKLEGLGNDWMKLGNTRQVQFSRLPVGDYTLIFRVKNGFGAGAYKFTAVRFSVQPYFYETWWFRLLELLLLISSIAFLFEIRNKRLIKKEKILENEVRARTQELYDSMNKLNETIEELYISDQMLHDSNELKEKTIAIILHDIKAPLNYLNKVAIKFNNDIERLSTMEIKEFSTAFALTLHETNRFVEELLQWLLAQKESFKPASELFALPEILEEVKALYGQIADWKNTSIKIQVPDKGVNINTDRNILKLIVRNLVDNAIKNTNNGLIIISAGYEGSINAIWVTIEDNGKGISRGEFDRILTDSGDGNISGTSKIGFQMIKSFLKLIDGKMQVESKTGKGTKIRIMIRNNAPKATTKPFVP